MATRPARPAATFRSATDRRSGRHANPVGTIAEAGWLFTRRNPNAANVSAPEAPRATLTPPAVNLHNNTGQTIWVYNLPNSGDYSIPAGFTPVEVASGSSTPVTLAAGNGPAGSAKNRIYVVEGPTGFTLPVTAPSGVDAFNPTVPSAGNSFLNYSFVEYYLYPANGGSQYTIDTSYIDEWSLPVQMQFTLNGAGWQGAVDGKRYGFNDFDTVVSQLKAAGKNGTPYADLVWSGSTPWVPQPPATVSRIVGPNKVWTQQSYEPDDNVNMNVTGWVPASYQDFVQYGSSKVGQRTVYPYAQDGKQYSPAGNFTFWKDEVSAPASTPYPMALRTAAILDNFPADKNGVYGFFTYPNDETAGQFTNIPSAVSLDLYVYGSSDHASSSVIQGGDWLYTSDLKNTGCQPVSGTEATDTFILDRLFKLNFRTPRLQALLGQHDIVVIDSGALRGATSNVVDVVDKVRFWRRTDHSSQFVYETSTGNLYYDRHPALPGHTGMLAKLLPGTVDPTNPAFVL